jgi:hypothetical protein
MSMTTINVEVGRKTSVATTKDELNEQDLGKVSGGALAVAGGNLQTDPAGPVKWNPVLGGADPKGY